jgi:hypothetical protein
MMKAQTVQYLTPLRNIGLSSTEDLLNLTKEEFDMICAAVRMKLMDKIRLAHALRDLEGKDDLVDSVSVVSDSVSVLSGSEPPGLTIRFYMKDAHPVLSEMLDLMHEITTPSSESGWFYLDTHGAVQGPFPRHTMRKWFLDGHLKPSLCVRYGRSRHVAFQSIEDKFQPSERAFAPLKSLKALYGKFSELMFDDESMKEVEGREFLNKWLGV